MDLERNSFEYCLQTKLFILYRDSNREVVTYDIPIRFLTIDIENAKTQYKEDVIVKQARLKEELKALIEEYETQQKLKNNPRYAEYLKLKVKYGKEKKDGNRTRQ